jgi:molecular chaperone GrpE
VNEKRDDAESELDDRSVREDEDVYVLEDEEISYDDVLEQVEQESAAGTGSEPSGLAPVESGRETDALQMENLELRDRLLRIVADHENFKKRSEKERRDSRNRTIADVIREFLPVLDNFERAIASGRAHEPDSELLAGIEMIHDQFQEIFTRLGVDVIGEEGVAFDPMIHEGVSREENPDVPSHTVVQVLQKGYSLAGKLLRPAMVRVAVGGPEQPDTDDPQPSGEERNGDR